MTPYKDSFTSLYFLLNRNRVQKDAEIIILTTVPHIFSVYIVLQHSTSPSLPP
jgi:hypothetical protein